MATYTPYVVACFAVLCHIQMLRAQEDATYSGCVPQCARPFITQYKRQLADQAGLTLVGWEMWPYPGGNQCWDCETSRRVWNSVSSDQHSRRRRRHVYNFDEFPTRRWSLPISYIFNDSVPSTDDIGVDVRAVVRGALSHIEARTCIRFTETSRHPDQSHFSFGLGSSCVAFVGRPLDTPSSPIFATADCFKQFGEMLYLVGQNLGLWHVTQRYDRDTYVRVVTSNLQPGHQSDLNKLDPSSQLLDTHQLPYDYASLMHFPPQVYSENGSNTIDTLDELYNRTIGQRVQLSFIDTKLLNLAYCSESCRGRRMSDVCQNGGYQDPNNCHRCLCPDGFAGDFCTELEPAQRARCGGILTATTTEQRITSPGYNSPGYYDSQIKCTWRIQAASGERLRVRFVGEFGVFCKNSACYDWVEVRYTGLLNNTGPRFCCNHLPSTELMSTSHETLVIFQSNASDVETTDRRGFQLAYSTVTSQNDVTTSATATDGPSDGGDCEPNPCHNHGRCQLNSTSSAGFTCTCPPGLWGPLCQQGCCGGCGARPGIPVQPCTAEEYPQRMCNVTRWYPGSRRRWGPRGRGGWFDSKGRWVSEDHDRSKRHAWPRQYKPRTVEVPCKFKFCCDNAERVGIPNVTHLCAVSGWTDWSRCWASCGGGTRQRVLYEIQTQTNWAGVTVVRPVAVNRTSELCNTQVCNCPSSSTHSRWRWDSWSHWWCSRCNWGFREQSDTCVPTQ